MSTEGNDRPFPEQPRGRGHPGVGIGVARAAGDQDDGELARLPPRPAGVASTSTTTGSDRTAGRSGRPHAGWSTRARLHRRGDVGLGVRRRVEQQRDDRDVPVPGARPARPTAARIDGRGVVDVGGRRLAVRVGLCGSEVEQLGRPPPARPRPASRARRRAGRSRQRPGSRCRRRSRRADAMLRARVAAGGHRDDDVLDPADSGHPDRRQRRVVGAAAPDPPAPRKPRRPRRR